MISMTLVYTLGFIITLLAFSIRILRSTTEVSSLPSDALPG